MAATKNIKRNFFAAAWRFLTAFIPVRDRYILQNFLYAYFICAFSFIGIYVAANTVSRLDKFTEAPFSLLYILFHYYAVMIPVVYTYYLGPLLTLSAAMFTLAMLNKHNELLPLKNSGLSLYRILAPILGAGGFFCVLTFLSQELLLPNLKGELHTVYGYSHREVSRKGLDIMDSERTRFHVGRYWPGQKRGEDVIVTYQKRTPDGASRTTRQFIADYIVWEQKEDNGSEGLWVLRKGQEPVREYRFDENEERITFGKNGALWKDWVRYTIKTDLTPADLEAQSGKLRCFSLKQLHRQWKRLHNEGILLKIHQHCAFPLTHIILLLLGMPFVLNQNTRSAFMGVLVGIGICGAYYVVNGMCAELGEKGTLQPMLSAWLPVLLFTGLGTVLFDNLRG